METIDQIAMYYGYFIALFTWPQLILLCIGLAVISMKWGLVALIRFAMREYRDLKRGVSDE